MLYIENTAGADISVVDETALKEIHRIPIQGGVKPDDVAASPDGAVVYCNAVVPADHPHFSAATRSVIVAIDPAAQRELWRIDMPHHVGHMSISADGARLYVALFNSFYVADVDLKARSVSYIPVMFNGGHGTRLSSDGKRLYVGSILMSRMDLIDLDRREVVKSFHFPDNVRPFHHTPDESLLFVQNTRMHGFHVVDTASARILKSIALPTLPPGTPVISQFPHTVDHGLEVTPDGKLLFAVATTGNYVAVYALPNLTLEAVIAVGEEPNWITIDPAGARAYVSNRKIGSDNVSVIDVATLKEIARVPVGRLPQRMCIA